MATVHDSPQPPVASAVAPAALPVGPEASAAPPVGPEAPAAPPVGPEAPAAPPVGPEASAAPPVGPEASAAPPVGPEASAAQLRNATPQLWERVRQLRVGVPSRNRHFELHAGPEAHQARRLTRFLGSVERDLGRATQRTLRRDAEGLLLELGFESLRLTRTVRLSSEALQLLRHGVAAALVPLLSDTSTEPHGPPTREPSAHRG